MVKSQKKIKKRNKKKKVNTKNRWASGFYLFFGVLFIGLPFVYYRNGLDPASHPRLLFISLVLIISLILLFWLKRKSAFNTSLLRNPVFYLMAGYFLITAASGAFAINPFEGNYDISKSFVFLVLTGVMSILLFNTPDWHKKLPVLFLFPAIYLLGAGASEYFEFVMFAETTRDPDNLPWIYQVRGRMAHKNQFAIALMLMLPFLGYGAFSPGKIPRLVYIVVLTAILFALVILGTRSVWVGFAFSVMLIVVFLLFYGGRYSIPLLPRQIAGVTIVLLALGLGSILYFSETENQDSLLYKMKNITNPQDENNIHRLKIWKLSLEMIADEPLTGVGAGNWKIESRYYFRDYHFTKKQLNWLRPHNDYLWVFAEKGLLGFLAFTGIFIWVFLMLHRILISADKHDEAVFFLLVMTGIVSYLTVSFFTFPLERMNHQVYLALMIASVVAMYQKNVRGETRPASIKPFMIIAFIVLGFSVVYSVSAIKMETRVQEARNFHRNGQWQKLLEISSTIPKSLKTLDAEAMPIAWYSGLANSKLGNIEASNKSYEKAYRAHPTHVMVLNNLGRTYFQLGEYEKAKVAFAEALEILPDYFESLVNITSSYIKLDDYEKAKLYIDKINRSDMNDQLRKMKRNINRKLTNSTE